MTLKILTRIRQLQNETLAGMAPPQRRGYNAGKAFSTKDTVGNRFNNDEAGVLNVGERVRA